MAALCSHTWCKHSTEFGRIRTNLCKSEPQEEVYINFRILPVVFASELCLEWIYQNQISLSSTPVSLLLIALQLANYSPENG